MTNKNSLLDFIGHISLDKIQGRIKYLKEEREKIRQLENAIEKTWRDICLHGTQEEKKQHHIDKDNIESIGNKLYREKSFLEDLLLFITNNCLTIKDMDYDVEKS